MKKFWEDFKMAAYELANEVLLVLFPSLRKN